MDGDDRGGSTVHIPARWAPDPSARHRLRYWAGSDWSRWVSDSSREVTADPLAPAEHYAAPPDPLVAFRASEPRAATPRRPAGPVGLSLYALYVVVFSFVGVGILLDQPGEAAFEIFMLGAAPVFFVPAVRALMRVSDVTVGALGLGLVASVAVPTVAHAVCFRGHDWSSSDLGVLFALWAATLVGVAFATRFLARQASAPTYGASPADEPIVHRDTQVGALLGVHFGAIYLGLALGVVLDHMGPERRSYFFGTYLGSYWPRPGDWRLELPVALVAMLAVVVAVSIDLVRWRGWPPERASALGDVGFGLLALIAVVTTVGLLAGWWRVVPAGGSDSPAALLVLPVYLLGVAVFAMDWRAQRTADRRAQSS